MADESNRKPGGKAAENTLALIGSIAGVAGNLLLGPDSAGMDFGAPFKAGAAMLQGQRQENDLKKYLMTTPQTAPLADHIPAIIQAGGLIKNPDVLAHPETQQYLSQFGGPAPAQAPGPIQAPASQGGVPAPAAPTAPVSTGPIAPPIPSPTGNLLSALGRTTGGVSPELQARILQDHPDILKAMASKDPTAQMKEMLQTVLLGKHISDFETHDQKTEDQLKEKFSVLHEADRLTEARAKAARLDKASQMAPTERQALESLDNSIVHMQALPDSLSAGDVMAANVGSKHPSLASFIPGNGPNAARIQEGLQAAKIQFASALKGARINDRTIQAMTASFPDPTKNPELWPQMKQQVLARMNLAKLVQLSHLASAGKTEEGMSDGTPVMDPNQKADFDVWFKTFEKYGQGALKSPQFQNLTKQFGLDSLFINPTTPIQK